MLGCQCSNTKHIQGIWLAAGGQSWDAFFSVYLPGTAMAYTSQPFGSIPCWRNFSRQASSTHAEKFAPGVCDFSCSTLLSISSISSCGKRIFFCADFALIALVAIFPPVCDEGTPYQKKRLTCTPTENIVGPHLEYLSIQEIARPGSAATLTGPLTKPLKEVTIMADQQHTQTRPKFTWLFLAKPKSHPNCQPVIVRFSADTEDAARQAFLGWSLTFAAKIRTESPCRFAFHDYASGMSLAFDNGEVRHA